MNIREPSLRGDDFFALISDDCKTRTFSPFLPEISVAQVCRSFVSADSLPFWKKKLVTSSRAVPRFHAYC